MSPQLPSEGSLEHQLIDLLQGAREMEQKSVEAIDVVLDGLKHEAGDGGPDASAPVVEALREHREQTQEHERRVGERLEALDAPLEAQQGFLQRLGSRSVNVDAELEGARPFKAPSKAYAFEHIEIAFYQQVERVARRLGDDETVALVRELRGEEEHAAATLASHWDDLVEDAAGRSNPQDDLALTYELEVASVEHTEATIHALSQAARAPHVESFGLWDVVTYFEEHKAETERQRDRLAERLEALGRKAKHKTKAKDRVTSVLVGLRGERPFHDTAVRLGAEAMEVAVYEMLARLADRAGDEETATLAREHLAQEQAMAERIDDDWDRLVDIALAATGVSWEPERRASTTTGRIG